MSSIDSVAQKYRGLHLSAIAQGLEQMLGERSINPTYQSSLEFGRVFPT